MPHNTHIDMSNESWLVKGARTDFGLQLTVVFFNDSFADYFLKNVMNCFVYKILKNAPF